jgi:transposase
LKLSLKVDLSAEQRRELEAVRDHHALAHMREKAAALLKIGTGQSGLQVAHHGLLKRRDADTIYRWVDRYQAEGVKGLLVRQGRGRKPAFSPDLPGASSGKGGAPGSTAHQP